MREGPQCGDSSITGVPAPTPPLVLCCLSWADCCRLCLLHHLIGVSPSPQSPFKTPDEGWVSKLSPSIVLELYPKLRLITVNLNYPKKLDPFPA